MPSKIVSPKGTVKTLGAGSLLLAGVLIATLTALFFVATARSTPWKSFVADLDHDGTQDVATHGSLDQCVQHIRSLKVSGTCGFQCNLLNRCVTHVQVDGDRIGPEWRTAPGD